MHRAAPQRNKSSVQRTGAVKPDVVATDSGLLHRANPLLTALLASRDRVVKTSTSCLPAVGRHGPTFCLAVATNHRRAASRRRCDSGCISIGSVVRSPSAFFPLHHSPMSSLRTDALRQLGGRSLSAEARLVLCTAGGREVD